MPAKLFSRHSPHNLVLILLEPDRPCDDVRDGLLRHHLRVSDLGVVQYLRQQYHHISPQHWVLTPEVRNRTSRFNNVPFGGHYRLKIMLES